jgi:hypothetical protein
MGCEDITYGCLSSIEAAEVSVGGMSCEVVLPVAVCPLRRLI